MGLIKELTLLPVAPLRFTVWVADKVADEVERTEYSPAAGVRKLQEIEQARERGEMDKQEAEELESQIFEQQVQRAAGPIHGPDGEGG